MNLLISWLPLILIGSILIAVFVRLALVKSGKLVSIKMSQADRNTYAIWIFALFVVASVLGAVTSESNNSAFMLAMGCAMALIVRQTGVRYRWTHSQSTPEDK